MAGPVPGPREKYEGGGDCGAGSAKGGGFYRGGSKVDRVRGEEFLGAIHRETLSKTNDVVRSRSYVLARGHSYKPVFYMCNPICVTGALKISSSLFS